MTAKRKSHKEYQCRWELIEDPPEGWRFGHHDVDEKDGTYWSLWLNPDWPDNTSSIWIQKRRIEQVRTVTEWVDCGCVIRERETAVAQRDVAREQVHSINLALIAMERRAIRAESDLADARQYAGGRTWDPEH